MALASCKEKLRSAPAMLHGDATPVTPWNGKESSASERSDDCESEDIVEIKLRARSAIPALTLPLPRGDIGEVWNEDGELFPALDEKLRCINEFSTKMVIFSRSFQIKGAERIVQIRIGTSTNRGLLEYPLDLIMKDYRDAYKSGNCRKIGDWYLIPNRAGAFYDPDKIRFTHDRWLVYNGLAISAVYKGNFGLSIWDTSIPIQIDPPRLNRALLLYYLTVDFLDKYGRLQG